MEVSLTLTVFNCGVCLFKLRLQEYVDTRLAVTRPR